MSRCPVSRDWRLTTPCGLVVAIALSALIVATLLLTYFWWPM